MLTDMRRFQAILLILGLLATPLAAFANGLPEDMDECGRMCCPVHGGHGGHAGHSDATPGSNARGKMACSQGGGHAISCLMRSGHRQPDYGLAAPLAPAIPSHFTLLAVPEDSQDSISLASEESASGFLSPPFEPPRQ